ncbi:hypothetical protein GF373_17455 [bacterium]|nr:hypothetical protein [bacterium]
MRRKLYGAGRSEISLRDELIKTLNGSFPEMAKKQIGLVRIMRRDSNGTLIKCECRNEVTDEPSRDIYCPYCLGEGFYWDEAKAYFYSWQPGYDTQQALKESLTVAGNLNVPFRVFYLDYKGSLTFEDRVVELLLDKNGIPSRPLKRKAIWRIGTLEDVLGDSGRLEFWKAVCFEYKMVFLNAR